MTERTYHIHFQPYPKHYVYVHFHPRHPNDEAYVVYIGKGVDSGAWNRYHRLDDHRYWMRDWQDRGYTPDQFVRVVRREMTEERALTFEKSLIQYYLERGCSLFNREKWQSPAQRLTYKPYFDIPK
jgi:hypothetical protein